VRKQLSAAIEELQDLEFETFGEAVGRGAKAGRLRRVRGEFGRKRTGRGKRARRRMQRRPMEDMDEDFGLAKVEFGEFVEDGELAAKPELEILGALEEGNERNDGSGTGEEGELEITHVGEIGEEMRRITANWEFSRKRNWSVKTPKLD
jgi:hypothetical protein